MCMSSSRQLSPLQYPDWYLWPFLGAMCQLALKFRSTLYKCLWITAAVRHGSQRRLALVASVSMRLTWAESVAWRALDRVQSFFLNCQIIFILPYHWLINSVFYLSNKTIRIWSLLQRTHNLLRRNINHHKKQVYFGHKKCLGGAVSWNCRIREDFLERQRGIWGFRVNL